MLGHLGGAFSVPTVRVGLRLGLFSALHEGGPATLTIAVNFGMRITFPMLLMASPSFGDWTKYFPRNPGFM